MITDLATAIQHMVNGAAWTLFGLILVVTILGGLFLYSAYKSRELSK